MPWKLTVIQLHLPLLSGLKPEALVLPAVRAMAPGWATGLTLLYLEIRRWEWSMRGSKECGPGQPLA